VSHPICRLEWTEKLRGWFAFGKSNYQAGAECGRAAGTSVMLRLTIGTDDVYRLIDDSAHTAGARGWINSDALGGRLRVERGTLNLFVDSSSKQMLYRLFFTDAVGRPLTLAGFKDIHTHQLTAVWPETTTLYTRILAGHVQQDNEDPATLVGCGILRILPTDFAWQMTTFRSRGPGGSAGLGGLAAFGKFFASELWEVYGPRMLSPRRA
jgi:cholesterol oxidase